MKVSKVILIDNIGRISDSFCGYDAFTRHLRYQLTAATRGATITNGMPAGTATEADTDGDSTGADGAPAAKAGDDDDGGDGDGEPARPRPSTKPPTSPRKALNRAPLTSATAHVEQAAEATSQAQPVQHPQHHIAPLLRLPEVLRIIPVSRSTWYDGVQAGRYPQPVKIGARATAWRSADILALTV